jgi:hypothetical protein
MYLQNSNRVPVIPHTAGSIKMGKPSRSSHTCETLSPKQPTERAEVVEQLPNKCEALSSNPRTAKKEKEF